MALTIEKGRPENCEGRLAKEIRTYDYLDTLGIEYERIDHESFDTLRRPIVLRTTGRRFFKPSPEWVTKWRRGENRRVHSRMSLIKDTLLFNGRFANRPHIMTTKKTFN